MEDQWKGIAYGINFDEIALPANPESSIIDFVLQYDIKISAVIEVKLIHRHSFECVAISSGSRWRYNINWVQGNWIVQQKVVIQDGYYAIAGYPSVNAASCTGYLAKLYPSVFRSSWVYSSIEVKNIGYFIYNRVVYRVNNIAYEGVIRTTYGVENSHSLISWGKVQHIVFKNDYGYGANVNWNYGYDNRYFFDYKVQVETVAKVQVQVQVEVEVEVELVLKDQLCSYFDNGKCISCHGDYYADNNGVCVRIES